MPYDTNEAQQELDRIGALARSPENNEDAAAKQLLKALASLREPAGLMVRFVAQSECVEITVSYPGGPFRRVWFSGGRGFRISEREQAGTTRELEPPIEYDALKGEFVGVDVDPEMVQVPGQKRQKRDALVALILAIKKDLDRK
jgi:hypothetical protein